METMKERFLFLKQEHGITYKTLSEALGMSTDAIRMSIGRGKLKQLQYQEIERTFHISRKWIELGEGEMLLPGAKAEAEGQPDFAISDISKQHPADQPKAEESKGSIWKNILNEAEQTGIINPNAVCLIRNQLESTEQRISGIPYMEIEYMDLLRKYREVKARLQQLLNRKEGSGISEESNT